MKTMQFPLAKITLFFMVGLLLGFAFEPSLNITVGYLVVGLVCLFVFKSDANKSIFSIFVILTSTGIGLMSQGVSNISNQKNHYFKYCQDPNTIHKMDISIREKLKSNDFTTRYFGIVNSIDGKICSGKILINIYRDSTKNELIIGNRILIDAKIAAHKKPSNPNQFDYGSYLLRKSILSQVSVSKSEIKINAEIDKNLWYYTAIFRERIIFNLQKKGFRKQELQVANALILGQQQEIDKDVLQDYQFAGAVHILSVSGLHVGYIVLFLNLILGFLPKNKFFNWFKFVVIIFALWTFAFVAGLSPSVVRSATMFSFMAAGLCLGRENNIFHTLIASLFFILLVEPSFIFDVGFQLSYVSLFFILWLQPLLLKIYDPKNIILKGIWSILTVSAAAQLGAFPLSVYYFHQFPGLFFITNLVILPCLLIVMFVGLLVMILAYFDIVPIILIDIFQKIIYVMNWTIGQIASIENFVLTQIPLNKMMLLSLYLVIVTWILWFEKSSTKKLIVALCSVLLLQMCVIANDYFQDQKQELIVLQISKKTAITKRNGKLIEVISDSMSLKNLSKNKTLNNYLVANFAKISKSTSISNLLFYRDKNILVLDSSAVFSNNITPKIAIVTQSPKINFDRFLTVCKPKIVIADGSNYKSYLKLWQKSCFAKKIPFHATVEKGFYSIE